MNKNIISLNDYLNIIKNQTRELSDKEVINIFKQIIIDNVDFHNNEDMMSYLLNNAINYEKHHMSRNFIIEDSESNDILGFFSLSLKVINLTSLSKREKKKIILKGKSPNSIDYIPVLLIGQLGKNTKLNKISGDELFALVLEKIIQFRAIVGTKMIFLDSINVDKIIYFYEQFGFVRYGDLISDKHGNSYQPMALNMDTIEY